MMHHGFVRISIACLLTLLAISCEKAKPEAAQASPPVAASSAIPSEQLVPPESSPPIEVPRLAMKSIPSENRLVSRGSSADPFIPNGSEALRLPFDFVIGRIGDEGIDPKAYRFAFDFLAALVSADDVTNFYSDRGRQGAASVKLLLEPLLTASVRLGGGEVESDMGASFMVRFVGKESSVSGELHLIRSSSSWLVDELILDEPVADYGSDGSARFDPFTYTRFL